MIEVGIIGASFANTAYLPALRLIEAARVTAIASARLDSARQAAASFGVPHAYDDWRRMLADHRFDLVCIATPTVTHAPMTLAALAAGAHVLCEKPMAMNAAEAETMLACAVQQGRLHMIDHELRFDPNRRRIKQLIDSGALGALRHATVTNVGASWADPASRDQGDWWSLSDQGGGRLGANGSHQIDLLRWWFGEIAAVCGMVRTLVPNRLDKVAGRPWTATADDYVQFNLEMAAGGQASVMITTVAHHGLKNETLITGSEGSVLLSNDSETLLFAPKGTPLAKQLVDNPYATLPGIHAGIWTQAVVGALREFCSAISEGRALREGATFEDGLRNQRVMDAIRQSESERRWVALTPVDEAGL